MYKQSQLESALDTLRANSDRVPSNLTEAFQDGKIKVLSNVVILRKEVSVGGKQSMVDSDTKKVDGVSDFDGNKLVDYRALIVNALKLGCRKRIRIRL